jgi:Ca2+-dependent lipid-binding protein
MELGEGILSLTLVEGKLYRDTEIMGKMSPYCTITFNQQKLKTKIDHNAGKKPVWNDVF